MCCLLVLQAKTLCVSPVSVLSSMYATYHTYLALELDETKPKRKGGRRLISWSETQPENANVALCLINLLIIPCIC